MTIPLTSDATFDVRDDDSVLCVRVAGNQHSPLTLLLVHGLGQSMACFDRQFCSPLDRNRLVAFDLRGHGQSFKPRHAEAYTGLQYALDMKALHMTLSTHRCVLVGWSLGAVHIIHYLRHVGMERVCGLVFIDAVTEVGTPRFRSYASPELLSTYNQMGSTDP
jgi:non-heme chloroperoxidase